MLVLAHHKLEASTFNGVHLFFATRFAERQVLGETVTAWLAAHSHLKIHDIAVMQSSDAAFHCVTVVVFYFEP